MLKTRVLLFSMVLLQVISLFVFNSCSTSDTVRDYISDQMNPFSRRHVNYAVYSRIIDNKLNIFFSLQIPRNEITYEQVNGQYKGSVNIRMQLFKNLSDAVLDTNLQISRTFNSYEETQLYNNEKITLRFPLEKGVYRIEGLVTDVLSKSDFKLTANYTLDPKDNNVQLSSIRFLDSSDPEDVSIIKQIIVGPSRNSIFAFDMSFPGGVDIESKVSLSVTRLKSDTVIARPLYGLNPIQGSIETRGYKMHDEVYSFPLLDTLIYSGKKETISFFVPVPDTLKIGTYYATVMLKIGEQTFTSKKEVFHVFPENHPYIRNMNEAVSIIRYLTTTSEFEKIIADGDSGLKNNFDKFWLKLTAGNGQVAKRKIGEFYQRAEEANRYFSNYKPGWRTDLGMIYIVLGPPVTVEWTPTQLVWYYYYRRAGGNIPLTFNPIRVDDTIIGYSFDRFYYNYEDFWLESRRNWER